jgi:hypothetical protein
MAEWTRVWLRWGSLRRPYKEEEMQRIQFCLIIATAGVVGLCTGVRGDEQKIPIGELPKAVVDAVKKRFPKAELVGAAKETEGGKTEYEVMLKAGGKKIDLMLTPEGAITVIEREIAAADLPKSVRATLEKDYPGATYKRIEELIKVVKGKEKLEAYEVLLETADKKTKEVKVPAPQKKKTGARLGDRDWTTHFAEKAERVSTGRNPYFIVKHGKVE